MGFERLAVQLHHLIERKKRWFRILAHSARRRNSSSCFAKTSGVILFHGGGWSGGDLTQFRYANRYLASRGLVAATADYRMLTKAERDRLPASETNKRVCVTDAKSAIRWFKQHAADLGIDPQRIITGGGSAGGHVAVLATLNPGLNDPADPKDFDPRVAAYLLFNPAFRAADSADPAVDVLRVALAALGDGAR